MTDPTPRSRLADDADLPPLGRLTVDRDAAARDDPHLLDLLALDPRTRAVLLHRERVFVAASAAPDPARLERMPRSPDVVPLVRAYLGRDDDGAAVELHVVDDDTARALAPPERWLDLRAAVPLLEGSDAALAVTSVALGGWHARHPRCPRCGSTTTVVQSGWSRRCDQDGSLHFPRTDPAVIVLVTDDDDRVLLGANAAWAERRFSLLAGFVEPGESLEAAVVREVAEEAGIAVDRVEYVGSQPWPFPASLMLGFTARVAEGTAARSARPDGEEIVELQWFGRDDLDPAVRDAVLPGSASIARWMLERWYGAPLGDTGEPWSRSPRP